MNVVRFRNFTILSTYRSQDDLFRIQYDIKAFYFLLKLGKILLAGNKSIKDLLIFKKLIHIMCLQKADKLR